MHLTWPAIHHLVLSCLIKHLCGLLLTTLSAVRHTVGKTLPGGMTVADIAQHAHPPEQPSSDAESGHDATDGLQQPAEGNAAAAPKGKFDPGSIDWNAVGLDRGLMKYWAQVLSMLARCLHAPAHLLAPCTCQCLLGHSVLLGAACWVGLALHDGILACRGTACGTGMMLAC